MSNEKGFFDELVEDFASTMEMKAAIEASRDKNGKIDIAKATGISMGLGHTSDNDIAMMGALLGTEGAFDDDDDMDFDFLDDFDDDFVPSTPGSLYTAPNKHIIRPLTEWDYEGKKAGIIAEKKYLITASIVALCLVTIFFLYMMGKSSVGTGAYWFLMLIIDGLLGYTIYYVSRTRDQALADLENRYRQSKRMEEEKKKAEQADKE